VSPLYLYAVLGAVPATPIGEGMMGEALHLVDCGEVIAAAGEIARAPSLAPDALRSHDAVVRRLADVADAVLPARFGTVASDRTELCELLARISESLRDALAQVAGREQMILRVFADAADAPSPPPVTVPGMESGPGTRYLAERARAHRATAELRELAPLRPVLDRFVAGERVERHDTPPLVASVYHLLPRGAAAAYTAAVEDAVAHLPGLRVTISGPWAPYAFAPDALG